MRLGDVGGRAAPDGPLVKSTLWTAELSWSTKVIVVPGATFRVAGEKFSCWLSPTPWGRITVAPEVELDELELALELAELLEEVPVPDEVAEVEVEQLAEVDEELPDCDVLEAEVVETLVEEEFVPDAELIPLDDDPVVDVDELVP